MAIKQNLTTDKFKIICGLLGGDTEIANFINYNRSSIYSVRCGEHSGRFICAKILKKENHILEIKRKELKDAEKAFSMIKDCL